MIDRGSGSNLTARARGLRQEDPRVSGDLPAGLVGDDEVLQVCGIGVRALLEEPVEQQPAAGRGAAVEAEGELVQVVGQLLPGDALVPFF